MKQKLTNYFKYNKTAYAFYYSVLSLFINILKLFVKTNEKLILFNSYAGRKYDDSPRVIFEEMKNDPRFKDFKLVWAFHEPEKHVVKGAEKIKTDSFTYFKTALAARVWVTNSSMERGLNFKGKNVFYFNTWHGTPIKKMGTDITQNQAFQSKGKNKFDVMNSQGAYETEIMSKAFDFPKEKFLECGYPRNDILAHYSETYKNQIRQSFGIGKDKKVILYCPTFREYEKDENLGVVMAPPIDLKKWEKELGDEFVFFVRAHYEVSKAMDIKDNQFVKNVTDYPALNDLMIAADILISDYSSIYFDFSITGKPMLHFAYDYDEYQEKRGMYFDIRDYIDGAAEEDALIKIIKNTNCVTDDKKTNSFRKKFIGSYGSAARQDVEYIVQMIMGK